MRKLLFIVLSAFVLFSCKKDRTCSCTYSDGTTTKVAAMNSSKKDAVSSCTQAAPQKIDPRTGYMDVSCSLDE